jgi:hypothetical protein
MGYPNKLLSNLLKNLDLRVSVAELDTLLETARIETSAFSDLLNDRVDLVPGTKGSGKSALFRIFVDFMPEALLRQRKVVVAHGVQSPGDSVFHAFTHRFSKLTEEEFVSFWCIYLVSLAHEQFIKSARYRKFLAPVNSETRAFLRACENARIPDIAAKKSLKDVLEWSLHVLASWRPKLTMKPRDGPDLESDLFGQRTESPTQDSKQIGESQDHSLPQYVNEVKQTLEAVLVASKLSLWLMVDRIDEIFPRRSGVERTALRGILRAMRYFATPNIRVKVFLRDDMLEQVVRTKEGFTAITRLTVRPAWGKPILSNKVFQQIVSTYGL